MFQTYVMEMLWTSDPWKDGHWGQQQGVAIVVHGNFRTQILRVFKA